MDQIPKPLLVFFAFLAAVGGILLLQPQYSACDAQIEIFEKKLAGEIFSSKGKKLAIAPRIDAHISSCKKGNGTGGCNAFFETLRLMNRELRSFPESCSEPIGAIKEVKKTLESSLKLMSEMAWGNTPPVSPEQRFGWFEKSDLALFCELRLNYEKLYGAEAFKDFRIKEAAKLPGEAPVFKDGKCTNCDPRVLAGKVFSEKDIWSKSLYSIACTTYR